MRQHSICSLGVISLAAIFLLALPCRTPAQEVQDAPGCFSNNVFASTDRPTYSNSTETTQCGVLEITGGTDRQWTGHGIHQDDLAQGLQLGLTPSIDLHYSGNLFFNDGSHAGPLSGVSDSYAGIRSRFMRQTRYVPSVGAFYTVKVPTSSPLYGMSTGRYDHFASLLMSKDLPRVHLDFNLTRQIVGRSNASGFDSNEAFVLFASMPVMKRLTFVGGSYGFNSLNAFTPAYAVFTVGFDWQVAHRLILDISMDEGLTSFAPRKRLGFGFTYAPRNLYTLLAHPKEPAF